MAPDVPLVVANDEEPFALLEANDWATCPIAAIGINALHWEANKKKTGSADPI